MLAELTDARLLTVSDGEVELSHEALLREWPRYRTWLEEDRIGRRVHAHLTAAATGWDERNRGRGELYRGARLAGAVDWAAQHDDQLNTLEREFIQATTRIDAGAVLAVRLANGGARLLVVDAHSVSTFDASPVRRLSSAAITPAPPAPSAAAISPDGSRVAVGSPTGQVWFADPATGHARPGTGTDGSAVTTLTYSPDGPAVASTGAGNTVTVWDPQATRPAQALTAPAEQVRYVAFSPDAATLYTSSVGGVLLSWDLTRDRSFGRRFPLGAGSPCCRTVLPPAPPLAVSPDGSTFAVRLGTSTVGLFSARTLRRLASFTIGPKGTMVTALAWSPTRPVLAVAGYSGLVQLWRVDGTPQLARSLTGLNAVPGAPEAIQALTFSPDGQLLAASDSGRTDTRGIVGAYLGDYDLRFAALAIWRASNGERVVSKDLGTGPGISGALAFSRNGKVLAASRPGPINSVLLLDPATGQVRQTLHPHGIDETFSLAFAPDGTLATGTRGGIAQLWNPASGDQAAGPVAVAAGPVTSIGFDPSGQRFATTGQDGTVKLWSSATLQQEGTALNTQPGAATAPAFLPGGRHLLVIDDHGNGFTWPTSLPAWEQRACAVAGRNLTRAEWARSSPDSPTRGCAPKPKGTAASGPRRRAPQDRLPSVTNRTHDRRPARTNRRRTDRPFSAAVTHQAIS